MQLSKIIILASLGWGCFAQTNHHDFEVTFSPDKHSYLPGETMAIRVSFENISHQVLRVPRSFNNIVGGVPSARVGFVNENKVQVTTMPAHTWPQETQLRDQDIESRTIPLDPGSFYGTSVIASAPEAAGCYSIILVFHSWNKIEGQTSAVKVPLGTFDARPDAQKICVKKNSNQK